MFSVAQPVLRSCALSTRRAQPVHQPARFVFNGSAWLNVRATPIAQPDALFNFPAAFLPVSFASQCLLDPQFLARLQIEGMALDLFDDVFLLHFPFEATKGVFQGFTFLESDFCQNLLHLQTDHRLYF
jgi:hypothetical protein